MPVVAVEAVRADEAGEVLTPAIEAAVAVTQPPPGGPVAGGPVAGGRAVVFDRLSRGGLALMERLVGADRAVLVDALDTGDLPFGTIMTLPLEELVPGPAGHLDSAHDASLPMALAAGRALGADLPSRVVVVGVEAERVYDFGEELSPAVEAAIGPATDAALAILRSLVDDPG